MLALTIVLPAVAFVVGSRGDRVTFMLYREPKLVAIQALGWTLLILLYWTRRSAFEAHWHPRLLRRPTMALLTLFIAYSAVTGLWVEVSGNYVYELAQLLLLLPLMLALQLWGSFDHRVRPLILGCLVVSLAPATVVGLVQLWVDIPFLVPIAPELGVRNPSLMGYKNPMALSLLAQLYLLAYLVFMGSERDGILAGRGWRRSLGVLLGLELVYVVTLQSRSTYIALFLTAPLFLIPLLAQSRDRRRAFRIAGSFALAMVLVAAVVASLPGPRKRLASVRAYLVEDFFEEDRFTYLVNTLGMARSRPFGVGLGDWQTHYPVYRAHNRFTSFTEKTQARRAHSDYLQILGETGWPGAMLWLLVVGSAVVWAVRRFQASGDRLFLALGVQLLAVAIAGVGDFFLEIPYNKFQFFLLLALLGMPPPTPAADPRRRHFAADPRRRHFTATGALVAVTLVGVFAAYRSVELFAKSYSAAALRDVAWETRARHEAGASVEELSDLLEQAESLRARFLSLKGHDKTFHKDYLILAFLAQLQGDTDQAIRDSGEALRLHPYYPNAFRMLAFLTRPTDKQLADHYHEAYDYIMNQASRGFRRPYPPFPVPKT